MKISHLFSIRDILLFLISVGSSLSLPAQDTNSRSFYRYSHPTPSQSSLINSVSSEINESSGAFSSVYPIQNIQHGEISYSLGLNYNSSDVRITSNASEVGLGWQLAAPPSVTRVMRTLPDDGYTGVQNGVVFLNTIQSSPYETLWQSGNLINWGPYQVIAAGCMDTEPDDFYFSFNSIQARFSYDWNGIIRVSATEKLLVNPFRNSTSGRIEKFEIIDSKGIKYVMDQIEESSVSNYTTSCIDDISYTTSWHASKIIDGRGNEVIFTYESNLIDQHMIIDQTTHLNGGSVVVCPGNLVGVASNTLTRTTNNQKLLKNINIGISTIITLDYVADRTDIVNQYGGISKRLSKIRTNRSGTIIDVMLVQDYSTGRLTLKEIKHITSPASLNIHKTAFEYEAGILPSISSRSIDEWGYYNGKINSHLVPPTRLMGTTGLVFRSGANRNPDFNFGKTGLLKKIINSLEGITTITYEANMYSYIQRERIMEPAITNVSLFNSVFGTCDYSNPACSFDTKNMNFNISNDNTVVTFNWNFTIIQGAFGDNNPVINIYKSNNVLLVSFNSGSNGTSHQMLFEAGNYRAELMASRFDPFTDNRDIASLGIDYGNGGAIVRTNKVAGGSRVKQILYKDPSGVQYDLVKYEYLGDDGFSSGVLNGNSSFVFEKESHVTVNGMDHHCKYIIRTSSNVLPIESFGGSHVLYRRVRKYREGLGSTVTRYLTYFEHGYNQEKVVPFVGPIVNSHYLGKMHRSQTFKGSISHPDSIEVLTQNHQQYFFDIPYMKIDSKNGTMSYGNWTKFYVSTSVKRYGIAKPGTIQLKKIESSKELILHTEYVYNSNLEFLKEKRQTTNSSTLITKYKYPHEFPGLSSLVARNFNVPIEVQHTNETSSVHFLSVDFYNYNINSNSSIYLNKHYKLRNNIGKTSFLTSSNGLNPSDQDLELVLEVSAVNTRGLETSAFYKSFGQRLIWDPVFEIPTSVTLNVSSGKQTAYSSFENNEKGGWTYSGTPTATYYKTGEKAYNLSSGNVSKTSIPATTSNPYKLSFWARTVSGTANLSVLGQTNALDTIWKLVEGILSGTNISITGTNILIDELRLHPVESTMTTYTHKPMIGITSITDFRNYTTKYEYDIFGRLKSTLDEDGQLQSHFEYNYKTRGNNQ